MNQQLILLLATIPLIACGDAPPRTTSAKGTLLCGEKPYEDARVRLYRMNSEDNKEILDYKVTSSSGMFQVDGNTQGRPKNESIMTPFVRIYHKCDENPQKDASFCSNSPLNRFLFIRGFRRFQMQIPAEFVFNGRLAKQAFNLGSMNLQLIFPGETMEKHFQE
ncbi:unnamed protein product [Anisakis simplex]|uniref:Transthyretin-like family protein n=1 Tax=Anisakis simplex TaxID=6269 RepID=A0A0M3K580_ANISI|nr:unnamed protein product [Anisakis simplex]